MDAMETETVEQDGQTYRIAVYPDGDLIVAARMADVGRTTTVPASSSAVPSFRA